MSRSDEFIVTSHIPEVRQAVGTARLSGCTIGCVPTMGALHAGHISLIEEARKRTDFVVVTIFVNPSQFAPHEDLTKYPRPLERDLQMCREAGANLVYVPEVPSLYPPGYQTWVTVEEMTKPLEGAIRTTHFRGVTTIVLKLFNIVQPDVACFGAKDFQQQSIIRRMMLDLDLPVEIVVCPTIREADGLALSSRNVYLSKKERVVALSLSQSLKLALEKLKDGERDLTTITQAMKSLIEAHPEIKIDYVTIADPDSLIELQTAQAAMVALIAARVGNTRLIDNQMLALP
jgi:pantoate--beta-alanine ligase